MTPYYADPLVTLYLGDCLDVMRELPDASVDSVCTDPPYGLEFMGKDWDSLTAKGRGAKVRERRAAEVTPTGVGHSSSKGPYLAAGVDWQGTNQKAMQAWHEQWATEAFRVLKPGGYLLAFGGTRTVHRLASAIEDAGFEIRDTLMWIYASGFPKSLDVSKALDKRREDLSDVQRVCAFLRDAHLANPKPRTEIDAHFGTKNVGGHWFTPESYKAECPPWEAWIWLKAWLGFGDEMDAEVWRLNGRKGKPGEAWDKREVVGEKFTWDPVHWYAETQMNARHIPVTAPATDLARKWNGWGTALKPAHEPIVMARKPLVGSVAANVTRYGTGALNIDGSRIGYSGPSDSADVEGKVSKNPTGKAGLYGVPGVATFNAQGRWPSNVLLSDPALFDEPNPEVVGSGAEAGSFYSGPRKTDTAKWTGVYNDSGGTATGQPGYGDSGGYSRFFLIPKADRAERERGLADRPKRHAPKMEGGKFVNPQWDSVSTDTRRANVHPTVKPIDLMRHLVKLVTPPGGTCLDPFAGSGTTGLAASELGVKCILIEREREYCDITLGRLMATPLGLGLFEGDDRDAA